MPTPRHARRLRRLRVPPPLPDVVLGGSRLRAPWEGRTSTPQGSRDEAALGSHDEASLDRTLA